MSILRFFVYFTVTYTLAMAALGVVSGIAGIENASSMNIPVLLVIAFWAFYSYSNKNARIVAGSEKWKLIFVAL